MTKTKQEKQFTIPITAFVTKKLRIYLRHIA